MGFWANEDVLLGETDDWGMQRGEQNANVTVRKRTVRQKSVELMIIQHLQAPKRKTFSSLKI